MARHKDGGHLPAAAQNDALRGEVGERKITVSVYCDTPS